MIAIVGVDLLYYVYHRMAHRVRLFWATHQAHHSSQYFNFATALRQKWNISGDVFLRALLPLFGVPPWMVFASFSINLVYQFWIHTERIGKLWRPIEFIFNTPSHHRVHHGMDQQYLDKNYGGIFILWDRLFGSFRGRDRPTALRPDQAGGHLQHLDAADVRVRGDRPRRAPRDAVARPVRLHLRAAGMGTRESLGLTNRRKFAHRSTLDPEVWTHGCQRGSAARRGLRFEFENRDGDRIGVVARRTGDFEVVVYPNDDPDQAQQVFRLTDDEADAWRRSWGHRGSRNDSRT